MSIRQGNAVISGGISKSGLRSKQDVLYKKSTGVSRGEIILGDSFNTYEVEILNATNFVFDTSGGRSLRYNNFRTTNSPQCYCAFDVPFKC